jgi:DNA-binding transcriptional LysR family regulator
MNLRQLQVFQAVMQTGSMSAAARLMFITPSAVSRIISHAELQLGYSLFARTRSGIVPTPEADILFTESAAIHSKLAELKRVAANLRQEEQRIRLAASPAISHELLPSLLDRHSRLHPGINIEVRTLHHDQFAQAILERSVDFGLAFFAQTYPRLTCRPIASGSLYAVATRSLWQRAQRAKPANPLSFFAQVPVIQLIGSDPLQSLIDDLVYSLGAGREPPQSGLAVQSAPLALELARRGMGWTIVDFVTARSLESRGEAALELHELHDLPAIPLCAYHATASPPGRNAQRMLEMLRAQFQPTGTDLVPVAQA